MRDANTKRLGTKHVITRSNIVINADDFGRDETTTLAILECFSRKWIDTSTLMVNMDFTEEAVRLAFAKNVDEKIGLHLNLMEGKPLTSAIKRQPVFCTNGVFNKQLTRKIRYRVYLNRSERKALQIEIEAQMERFLLFGFEPRYLDSHCSTHNMLPILLIVQKCMKKYGFESIRIARNISASSSTFSSLYKNLTNLQIGLAGMKRSQYFAAFHDYVAKSGMHSYKGTIEFMTHPYIINGEIVNLESMAFEEFFKYVGFNYVKGNTGR